MLLVGGPGDRDLDLVINQMPGPPAVCKHCGHLESDHFNNMLGQSLDVTQVGRCPKLKSTYEPKPKNPGPPPTPPPQE